MGTDLKSIAVPYHRGLHRFAIFTSFVTLALIVAGALVTSNDAGLSVPDWPTSFGSWYKMPQMVGGIVYEHGHRMVAEFVGLLTIVLAVWTWRVEKRRWLRWLGLAALATVIAQGVLGGITVLFYLPPAISTAHAALAQTFFCIAVAIAVFTGRRWVEEQPRVELDVRRPSLFTLTLLSIFVLYVQLILGAMFRHNGLSWWPHVVHAGVVAIVLSWTAIRAISVYPQTDAVRRPAIMMLSLMVAQLCLGFLAFITRVMWGRDAAQPELPMVISTVVHVAVGALLLATTVILAIQVWRHVPVSFAERVPGREQKPVVA
ncbi:MAG: COX15/CtaA family protein [Acidobacteriales bacterium]|nr:COX15/CtaA family protein [Candidatus Koribacter versatilis]MBI3646981.1 COX15/CtaA family protein [Terriglobales bacterium]